MCHSQKQIPFEEINNFLFLVHSRLEIILIKDIVSIFSIHTDLSPSGFSAWFSHQLGVQYQMASPENVHSSNITKTEKVIFMDIYIYKHRKLRAASLAS